MEKKSRVLQKIFLFETIHSENILCSQLSYLDKTIAWAGQACTLLSSMAILHLVRHTWKAKNFKLFTSHTEVLAFATTNQANFNCLINIKTRIINNLCSLNRIGRENKILKQHKII